jgi:hypothetical protein
MNPQEKKKLILKKIEDGDPRSYNQIAADLELELWTLRYKTPEWVAAKLSNRK